eukprot:TRINITY_DN13811_c0_g1_i1.p1 TRINITY_DN13811_c0_g1~~TRINITY_DN13811_c0_g1_i1.p1  ORF type:complete len:183 (-),score=27.03 TRINITY_DN13811_c0_g1_i1:46-594(-)
MYLRSKTSLRANYGMRKNSSMATNKRAFLNTSYRPRSTKSRKKVTLAEIEGKYRLIQETVNNPRSIYWKSKTQALKYKEVQYRLLYKDWRIYHENNVDANDLTLFHDHITYLRKNVYPFTLISNDKNSLENIEDIRKRPQTALKKLEVTRPKSKSKLISIKARAPINSVSYTHLTLPTTPYV